MSTDRRALLEDCLRSISTAAANAALYSIKHRQVTGQAAAALAKLKEAMADSAELTVMRVDEELFFDGKPLGKSLYLDRFRRCLAGFGIEHIRFGHQAGLADITKLIAMMARLSAEIRSTEQMHFGKVDILTGDGPEAGRNRSIDSYEDIPPDLLGRLVETYERIKQREGLETDGVIEVVNGFITSLQHEANPLMALAPLRAMDEYTFTHSVDVCILNLAQGMSLGIDGQLLHDIGVAAMLHDVGKLFTPPEVLNKAGGLDDKEWEIMRRHTGKGAAFLLNTPGVPRLAVLTAYEHHMKYDLSGYPAVPAGWQLNLCSQMTMVSDCFDAIRTRRVYKDAMDYKEAARIMLELAGTALNPSLTLNFLRVLKQMGEQ